MKAAPRTNLVSKSAPKKALSLSAAMAEQDKKQLLRSPTTPVTHGAPLYEEGASKSNFSPPKRMASTHSMARAGTNGTTGTTGTAAPKLIDSRTTLRGRTTGGPGASPSRSGTAATLLRGSTAASVSPRQGTAGSAAMRNEASMKGSASERTLRTMGATTTVSTARRGAGAPQPALGAKNSFFGTSERMEPTKWTRWARAVDVNKIGGHYDYIVGELGAARAMEDAEKREHDEMLAETLHKQSGEDSPSRKVGEKRLPMSAAFTDRSIRLREGVGCRDVFQSSEMPRTEWGDHGDCACPVCKPFEMTPAGQPSHLLPKNKLVRCFSDTPRTHSLAMSRSLDSANMDLCMTHDERASTAPVVDSLAGSMGRKIGLHAARTPGSRTMLPHRAMSEDRTPLAGNYDQDKAAIISQDRRKGRQAFQGTTDGSQPRTGMAMVLSPRPSDPPAPTQITNARKADGTFKNGVSAEAAMHSTYFNQSFFRFEGGQSSRSMSTPPDFRQSAGSPSGAGLCTTWNFGGANPITMEGHTTDRGFSLSRSRIGHTSTNMARVTNHEEGERAFALEKTVRLQNDKTFADLCAYTDKMMADTSGKALTFKTTVGHHTSPKIREAFTWNE